MQKMKKRVLFLVALVAVLLISGGPLPALADAPGKVTGGIQYTMELYAPFPEIVWTRAWSEFNVVEVDPWIDPNGQTHNAKGWYHIKTYHENTGWLAARVDVSCVAFGQDGAGSYALISGKVVSVRGLEPEPLGTYWVHKVYDNGTPGREGDLFGYYAGDAFPGWSYDAVCNVPEGFPDYSTGLHFEYPVERGDLVIHD
jgi:hypothetical protein